MATVSQITTQEQLTELLAERILVLDGAMGTVIHAHQLEEEDVRGSRFENHPTELRNCTDVLVLTQPELVQDIHRSFLEADADIIETDTFNATKYGLGDFGLQDYVYEINKLAAVIARRAVENYSDTVPAKPRFVAGSMGPTSVTLSLSPKPDDPGYRAATFDQMVAAYREQLHGLVDGGVDLLLVETAFDTLSMKACLYAIDDYFQTQGVRLPVMISGTIIGKDGRTLSGQTIEAFWASISHFDMLSVGLNCALGTGHWRLAGIGRSRRRDGELLLRVGGPESLAGAAGSRCHVAPRTGRNSESALHAQFPGHGTCRRQRLRCQQEDCR